MLSAVHLSFSTRPSAPLEDAEADGGKKVDISELERVYGREIVQGNLKRLQDSQ
jgi:hypothetical protein